MQRFSRDPEGSAGSNARTPMAAIPRPPQFNGVVKEIHIAGGIFASRRMNVGVSDSPEISSRCEYPALPVS